MFGKIWKGGFIMTTNEKMHASTARRSTPQAEFENNLANSKTKTGLLSKIKVKNPLVLSLLFLFIGFFPLTWAMLKWNEVIHRSPGGSELFSYAHLKGLPYYVYILLGLLIQIIGFTIWFVSLKKINLKAERKRETFAFFSYAIWLTITPLILMPLYTVRYFLFLFPSAIVDPLYKVIETDIFSVISALLFLIIHIFLFRYLRKRMQAYTAEVQKVENEKNNHFAAPVAFRRLMIGCVLLLILSSVLELIGFQVYLTSYRFPKSVFLFIMLVGVIIYMVVFAIMENYLHKLKNKPLASYLRSSFYMVAIWFITILIMMPPLFYFITACLYTKSTLSI